MAIEEKNKRMWLGRSILTFRCEIRKRSKKKLKLKIKNSFVVNIETKGKQCSSHSLYLEIVS